MYSKLKVKHVFGPAKTSKNTASYNLEEKQNQKDQGISINPLLKKLLLKHFATCSAWMLAILK